MKRRMKLTATKVYVRFMGFIAVMQDKVVQDAIEKLQKSLEYCMEENRELKDPRRRFKYAMLQISENRNRCHMLVLRLNLPVFTRTDEILAVLRVVDGLLLRNCHGA